MSMKKNLFEAAFRITSFILAVMFALAACAKEVGIEPEVISPEGDSIATNHSGTVFVTSYNFNSQNLRHEDAISVIVNGVEYDDAFGRVNCRSVGGVVRDMAFIDDKIYISTNNDSKVEIVDATTFKSISTVNGLSHPNAVANRNSNEFFVSNGNGYTDNYIYVVNKKSNQKTDSVVAGNGPSSMVANGTKLFVANVGSYPFYKWGSQPVYNTDNSITVVDISSLDVVHTFNFNAIPVSMELDEDCNLIVVCVEGVQYLDESVPEFYGVTSTATKIIKINTSTYQLSVIKEFTEPISRFGQNLAHYKDSIYYVDKQLYSFNGGSSLIQGSYSDWVYEEDYEEGEELYDFGSLAINKDNGDIWVTPQQYEKSIMIAQYTKDFKKVKEYFVASEPKLIFISTHGLDID